MIKCSLCLYSMYRGSESYRVEGSVSIGRYACLTGPVSGRSCTGCFVARVSVFVWTWRLVVPVGSAKRVARRIVLTVCSTWRIFARKLDL